LSTLVRTTESISLYKNLVWSTNLRDRNTKDVREDKERKNAIKGARGIVKKWISES
jgi:hypothetical protein